LWIFAAVAALVLHAGGAALAVAHMQNGDPEELGSPAIEIGLELTSPRLEATDLPAGPDTDASIASPALAEQKAEVKETELPKAVPTETENPDRVVALNDSKKPTEEDPKIGKLPRRQASMRRPKAARRRPLSASGRACSVSAPRGLPSSARTSRSTSAIRRCRNSRTPR
jgi:periplasmic protein TonB